MYTLSYGHFSEIWRTLCSDKPRSAARWGDSLTHNWAFVDLFDKCLTWLGCKVVGWTWTKANEPSNPHHREMHVVINGDDTSNPSSKPFEVLLLHHKKSYAQVDKRRLGMVGLYLIELCQIETFKNRGNLKVIMTIYVTYTPTALIVGFVSHKISSLCLLLYLHLFGSIL